MTEVKSHIDTHYLYPSALYAEAEPRMVNTVLGSCISVCLFDSTNNIGGINHYMLPLWNGKGLASPKYGNIAITKLLQRMLDLGSTKEGLVAKVFGGANQTNSSIGVGERNIQVAHEMLRELGIRVVAKSVGGSVGRKLNFNTSTGEVMMKYVKRRQE